MFLRHQGWWQVAGLALCVALPASTSAQGLQFTEATTAAGLTHTHVPPQGLATMPMLGGGAAADFDGDGWLDLFAVGGGGAPDRLFLNDQDGTFTDVALGWAADRSHVGGGPAAGDVDGDGWLDLFVASHGLPTGLGPGAHLLYRNQAGAAFVEDAVAAGVNTGHPSEGDGYGAVFGDPDRDGDLDLFVTAWMSSAGQGNRYFRNAGDGTFTDATAEAIPGGLAGVNGFSATFADMNGDRWPELLIAADFGTSRYLVNQGDGTYLDATASSGTGLDSNGMGHTVGDLDGDGLMDWYVTSIHSDVPSGYSGNMLYRNLGGDVFAEQAIASGANDGGWGWGTLAEDLDHDGDLDLVETNGWSNAEWLGERSYLYLNDGSGSFTESGLAAGFTHAGDGRGVVAFDADSDGDRDLVLFLLGGPMTYWRNDLSGPDAHGLLVRLDAAGAPGVAPQGVGALVTLSAGGSSQQRQLCGGLGFVTSNPMRAHFGLGAATQADELRVLWPDGTERLLTDVAADTLLDVACCAGWKPLGEGIPGATGVPALSGDGTLLGGDAASLSLSSAAPLADAWMVLGLSELSAPFKGGVLVPQPDVLEAHSTNGVGDLDLATTWPAGVPAGSQAWVQFWIEDPAAPKGYAASNGLRLTTP
jgi:hypothetical protein